MRVDDQNLRELRIDNIHNCQKKIQRLLSLIYVLFILTLVAWFSSNFESTELSDKIDELNRALKIEELKPWDDYSYKIASCFDKYFFGFDGRLVDKQRFKEYIDYYKKQNEELSPFIDAGEQGRYPIDKLNDIYDSDEHWSLFRFWSQQDTLVSYLFSLEYILSRYFRLRLSAIYDTGLQPFLDDFEKINLYVDSALVTLWAKIDSIKEPFSYAIRVGWNPFLQGEDHNFAMWGRWKEFDEYSYFDIEERIDFLHRLNKISLFKEVFKENRQLLEHIRSDLEEIVLGGVNTDSVRFSRKDSDIKFHNLEKIFSSQLWKLKELPDSIQKKRILNLGIEYKSIGYRGFRESLDAFYPEFITTLDKYKLDRISGIKSLKNILKTQQSFGQQRLQAFGVEVSYYTVLLILPAIVLGLYILSVIFVYHLNRITSDETYCIRTEETWELGNAPLIIMLRPTFLAIVLTNLPGALIAIIVIDQLGIFGNKSPFANGAYAIFYVLAMMSVSIWLTKNIKKIHRGSRSSKIELPDQNGETKVDKP